MGYELKRLMGQFGVSTPGVVNYSGANAPGRPPAADAAQADKDAFDESVRKYNLDTNSYDTYRKEYENRLQNSPGMYSQPQFNTVSNRPSTTYTYSPMAQRVNAPGGGGIDQANRNIQQWFAGNPNATPAERAAVQQQYGVSDRDIRNAMGSGFNQNTPQVTAQLRAPLYNPAYVPSDNPDRIFTPAPIASPAAIAPAGTIDLGNMYDLTKYTDWRGYARGGSVKTHYQDAGQVVLPAGDDEEEEVVMPPEFVMPAAVAAAPNNRMADLQSMLAAYGPAESTYAEELKTARERAQQESNAFANMLTGAMASPENEKNSKAELYFRLASAFGAPTRTGNFSENLGMVGKEMSEYSKDKRASSQDRLNLALKAQELKMGGAKEDLSTLRSLASEEMRDKRAIATEMIREYVASGKPQSTAGKQAQDEGLQIGTPEFNARVQVLSQINIDRQLQMIQSQIDSANLRQQNLNMQEEKLNRLSPAEQNLKLETENGLNQTNQALENLKLAYSLNPSTYDTSLVDTTQRKLAEISGSKNPRLLNTLEMENLLEKAALSSLKATFPGAISDGERAALMATVGLGAKSVEVRAEIMRNAYSALSSIAAKTQTRLNEINSGAYRMTTTPPATIDGGLE